MKFISWNVNGIRAWYKKEAFDWVLGQNPDFFCVQETKAEIEQLPIELVKPKGFCTYFNSSKQRKGHSGTVVYCKKKPNKVTYGLGIKSLDQQGRQINIFYDEFVLINCYFPNGGGVTERLLFKLRYYKEFLKFVNNIKKTGKSIIFCGDLNVAHEEIDIARPEGNKNSIGFLPEERFWLDEVVLDGYVDTFRALFPESVRYSWWDMKTRARDRNIGWRLDYFFISSDLKNKIKIANIADSVVGSDHAPIILELSSS